MKHALYILAILTVFVPTTGAALTASVDEISSEDVRTAAVAFIEERFPDLAPRVEVRVDRVGSKAESAEALRVQLNHSESIPKGRTQVRLFVGEGDGWTDAGWALLYVAHYDSVAVAQNDVPKGEPVQPSDITYAWMETTTFRGTPTRPADVQAMETEGLYAERPLRAGESIRLGDLRPPYAADTGQSLTMTYRKNGITLKLTCQAREPGVKGDVIRAYSPDTKSTYKVELTGPGAARWISTL